MTEPEAAESINALFESRYAALVRYASRFTGNVDVAEEIVQDAFFQLYRDLRAGKPVRNPAGWLVTVVRRQARCAASSVAQFERLEALERLPEGWVEQPPFSYTEDPAAELISVLSKREHEVLVLRMAAMKYREIAAQLEISSSSVNSLLARALKKLRHAAGESASGRGISSDSVHEIFKTLQ